MLGHGDGVLVVQVARVRRLDQMPVFPDEAFVAEVPAVNADATWHHVSVPGRRKLSKRPGFSLVVDGQIGEIKGRPVLATAIQPWVTGGDDRVSPSPEGRRAAAARAGSRSCLKSRACAPPLRISSCSGGNLGGLSAWATGPAANHRATTVEASAMSVRS